MILEVTFKENAQSFKTDLGEIYRVSDGGYERGFADGKQSEYDTFWDMFQEYGSRSDYYQTFRAAWNDINFKPKYPIIAAGDASYIFDGCKLGNQNAADFDFVEKGIKMNLSGATALTYAFRNCRGIKRLGVIDCTGCKDLNRLFYSCRVVTIDKFVVNENITYSSTFEYASRLENITIEGTIGNKIAFTSCVNLTHESLMSIINALKDFNGTGTTNTLTLGATNLAKLTDAEKAIATQKGWSLA